MSTHDEESLLLEHEADGIKELDNRLPRWWVWLFYLTIIYGFAYVGYYHILPMGKSSSEKYEHEVALARAAAIEAAGGEDQKPLAEEDIALVDDKRSLMVGKSIFEGKCSPCHMMDGRGSVGPNLTDEYWIHGGSFRDTVQTILNGNLQKGMVPWRGLMSNEDIQSVASYIYTLRGTNPPNPKPVGPDAVKYVPEK